MGRPARVGVAVTVGGDRHLFVPRFLDAIRPTVPGYWLKAPLDQWYPHSDVTRRAITPASLALRSTGSEEWHGWACCSGEIVDQAGQSRAAAEGRKARKAARRAELGRRWKRTDPNGYASRNAKAERRAAREARRIMMERRAQCIAAFSDIDTTEV